ncbi:GLPGLI family protein [Zhouia sp. PK063]|uniref:GLPGLI family protein n=1 Tax=Zhouia sp. PK063 TaxID=3373602 RepID=UPI0037BA4D17
MNKYLLTFLFVLLFSTISIGQESAICSYQIIPLKEHLKILSTDNKSQRDSKEMLIKALDLASSFKYTLEFNSTEALSSIDNTLDNENSRNSFLLPVAKALIGKGIYYQNISEHIQLRQLSSMGQEFIIRDSIKSNEWNISKEHRKIGKFNCYKATKNCNSCNRGMEEVWFTPEVPKSFGPLGYGGLPGLIIAVQKKTFILQLTEIKLMEGTFKIDKPSKGKMVSVDYYNSLTKQARKRASNMRDSTFKN